MPACHYSSLKLGTSYHPFKKNKYIVPYTGTQFFRKTEQPPWKGKQLLSTFENKVFKLKKSTK